jgi:hypothetical protein
MLYFSDIVEMAGEKMPLPKVVMNVVAATVNTIPILI